MKSLLEQLKKRRLTLGLKQKDMLMRIGISRQQYQHLESKGNPRLNTLELIAKGLKSEVMLIPREKVELIKEILDSEEPSPVAHSHNAAEQNDINALINNPWKGLLGDED